MARKSSAMRYTLNGGESPVSLPLEPEPVVQLVYLGRFVWNPGPVSQLPAFTLEEIDEALSTLKEV